jgi:hypothetical protein
MSPHPNVERDQELRGVRDLVILVGTMSDRKIVTLPIFSESPGLESALELEALYAEFSDEIQEFFREFFEFLLRPGMGRAGRGAFRLRLHGVVSRSAFKTMLFLFFA